MEDLETKLHGDNWKSVLVMLDKRDMRDSLVLKITDSPSLMAFEDDKRPKPWDSGIRAVGG
jgi:hypothetical protein